MSDFKTRALDFARTLTWKRLGLYAVAAFLALSMYTVWENRQNLFTRVSTSLNSTVDDFILEQPTKVGVGIVNDFLKQHPNVQMLTIVDANPIDNTRIIVHRAFNDGRVRTYVEERAAEIPRVGDGPLFTADADNNKIVLSILNGEFSCSLVTEYSIFARAFPDLMTSRTFQCRVPLPPSFGKATGWFSLLLAQPLTAEEYDHIKIDSLLMSLNYYNLEVLRQAQPILRPGRP